MRKLWLISLCFLFTACSSVDDAAQTAASVNSLASRQTQASTQSAASEWEVGPGEFTFILLPDTQKYTKKAEYQEIFMRKTAWMREHIQDFNIQAVLTLGDLTDNNITSQWEYVRAALGQLNEQVPYVLVTGNHDYGTNGNADVRKTHLNDFFQIQDNSLNAAALVATFEEGRVENALYRFTIGTEVWQVLALEFGPRKDVVAWADQVLSDYPQDRTIVLTHAYLYDDNTRYDWAKKGKTQSNNPHAFGLKWEEDNVADGEELWHNLISRHANVRFVFNGHVHAQDGVGLQTSMTDLGHTVHEMLFDRQTEPNGGDGWLRILHFTPQKKQVHIITYSPTLDKYRSDSLNDFWLTYE